jgi:hypothetical protein
LSPVLSWRLKEYHAQYWLNLAKSKFCVNLVAAKSRRVTKFVALAPPRAATMAGGRRPAGGPTLILFALTARLLEGHRVCQRTDAVAQSIRRLPNALSESLPLERYAVQKE